MDLSQRLGKYPTPPQAGPILGVECSGIAVEVSAEAADRFAVGDEVFGLTYGGAYAEYVAVQAGTLIHKPANLSWEEAAAIPEVNIIKSFEDMPTTDAIFLGLDDGHSSHVSCGRIYRWQNHSVARRCLFNLNRWCSAVGSKRRQSDIHHY